MRRDRIAKDRKKSVCRRVHVKYVHVCVWAKQEGSIRSDSGSRAEFPCGMGSIKRGGVGVAGMLAQAPGLSKAAHTGSDMQQIVKALPSYA